MTPPELPKLPEPLSMSMLSSSRELQYTAADVQAYAIGYAEAAVRAERERCAQICANMVSTETDWDTSYWNQAVERCAFAIRAQNYTPKVEPA